MTTYYMHTHNGGGLGMSDGPCLIDPEDCTPRPGLWIDPEDHETFRVALEAWTQATFGYTATPGDLQVFARALRSLIAPPRPEEPQGLGAVVEDEDGNMWVRTTDAEHSPAPWLTKTGERWSDYAGIAVVEVHNEGVTR